MAKAPFKNWPQPRVKAPPEYLVTETGPDHDKSFVAVAMVAGEAIAEGDGKSKREAEQLAARRAYEILSLPTTN